MDSDSAEIPNNELKKYNYNHIPRIQGEHECPQRAYKQLNEIWTSTQDMKMEFNNDRNTDEKAKQNDAQNVKLSKSNQKLVESLTYEESE